MTRSAPTTGAIFKNAPARWTGQNIAWCGTVPVRRLLLRRRRRDPWGPQGPLGLWGHRGNVDKLAQTVTLVRKDERK